MPTSVKTTNNTTVAGLGPELVCIWTEAILEVLEQSAEMGLEPSHAQEQWVELGDIYT